MTLPIPFLYSSTRLERRHGPTGYQDYGSYKPWLRDEFEFRCVYCLERETWYPNRAASFAVDHIVPQSQDANLIFEYTNLLYSCNRCNSARQDIEVLNPFLVAFGEHLRCSTDGHIVALTPEGQDLIDLLHLAEEPSLSVRRHQIRILNLKREYPEDPEVDQLFLEAFRYPEDLPDLESLRPTENTLPQGVETSYFARRSKGLLPATY